MSPQAGWILQEEVVPRLKSSIPRNVSCVGAEDAEELVQDATAIAAKMLHNVELAGRQVTPGSIAYYSLQLVKSGRRSTGSSVVDVMAAHTQLNGTTRLNSLDEPVAVGDETGGERFTFNDVLAHDQEDPSQIAARKMDWESFGAGLTAREQAVIECLGADRNLGEVAVKFGVCLSTIMNVKNRLAHRVLEFMGPDILKEVRKLPGWKNNLNTTRERLACRHDRRN